MASQSAGIQQLLAAEKRAAEKIDEAKRSIFLFKISNTNSLILISCYI